MRNQIKFLPIIFCLLQLACGKPPEGPDKFDFKPPKIVEAKTHQFVLETPPEVIPVSGVIKTMVGKPEIVDLKSNVFPAKAKRIIPKGTPSLIIPTGERFRLPRVVAAIDSAFIVPPPEIILIKEPFVKENNPESFSSIKTTHGLNSNKISSLCQDKAGNLWIGMWLGGVSKYDGRFLTNYSVAQGLSSDNASCILEDKSDNIWIGTVANGLNKFDGRYLTRYSAREGLSDNRITYMLQDKTGDMWFATENGLNKYDGHSFTHYTTAQGLPSNIIISILEDSKGNLWVGTYAGLARFDGGSFQNYTLALGLKKNTIIGTILEDSKGNLWFGTPVGLFKYDGENISHFTKEGGLSSNQITRIAEDFNGHIWIGTVGGGANKLDGKSFTHFGVEQGLGNDLVSAVLQDQRGTIWLGTTAGLSKYDGKLFSHVMPLRQEDVECVLADKQGNIWIGTRRGQCLNKYDGRSSTRYTNAQGLVNARIAQIIEGSSRLIWFATCGGAVAYDGASFTYYTKRNGLIDDWVYCVLEDRSGNLWFGTHTGLSKYDGKTFTNYSIEQGLKGAPILSLLQDHQDNIWIGTGEGVYSFDGKSFTQYIEHSLSHPKVVGMMEDKNNNIWFCTSMGINKFDGQYFTWYTTEQGLTSNFVKNVLEDKNGNIWIGTINGINLLTSSSAISDTLKRQEQSLFKKYTISEGFAGGGTFENSITQDINGNIWIGAIDRVAKYHPEGDILDTIPPNIQLSGIALFHENINWRDVEKKKDRTIILTNGSRLQQFNFSGLTPWYDQPKDLQLNYDNNYLTFQFIGITTYRPKEVRYQYFLEGFDENWSNVTDQAEATYSNLAHGKYTFKVKAVNSEGYWSNELNYSFVILPPWWRTWWAYLSYALSFCVAIWTFTSYRARKLKAENISLEEKVNTRSMELQQSLNERYELIKKVESQEALLKERLRISRELHDDIGSTLSSISIYSEVAIKRTAKKENTNEVLSKIGHASRELIDKMSDIVWSLNPNNQSFEQLQNRMVAFAGMMLASCNIRYDFTADEKLKDTELTGEQQKNIFLIFKEALHNIMKYAACKTVNVTFSLNNNDLIMTIKDDGLGFDVSQLGANTAKTEGETLGGNGIQNMHSRAVDINAKLCIHSEVFKGTTIRLTLQLGNLSLNTSTLPNSVVDININESNLCIK
jgi:ligand-binding sensor domain-containing protein/signal transduction histidine kinase